MTNFMYSETVNVQRLQVLLVPDSPLWITAIIARAIARHNPQLDFTICSDETFAELISTDLQGVVEHVDVVHLLTPQVAKKFLEQIRPILPSVATIHHVMDDNTVADAWPADAIMTASRQQESEILARGVPANAVVRVPYGVDCEVFRPGTDRERQRIRSRLGIGLEDAAVGFIGKKTSDDRGRKGMDVLTAAAHDLVKRLQGVHFVLVGSGWREVADSIRSGGGRCTEVPFLASQSRFAEVYRALDFYWVTARVEGGPVPLLEAMASGLVVVSTPVGLAPEVIEHGTSGFIVERGDSSGFVQVTTDLSESKEMRARVGMNARNVVISRWRWETTTQAIIPLYHTALANFDHRVPKVASVPRKKCAAEGGVGGMPKSLRRWIAARDDLIAVYALVRNGDTSAARFRALRAMWHLPFDSRTWLVGSRVLPGGVAIRWVGRTLRKLMYAPQVQAY